ncbi:MAG: ParB/RepB/Spo0J family partition protein [Clostridiaceae bacterium]|nr:ParB/RepB/Spo0J family partition protein [Clostridiaceae bacterium]
MLLGTEEKQQVVNIPISKIRPNPYQPRQFFDQSAIEELAASIREYGIIQPISVRAIGRDEYELVTGERRLRAYSYLNKTEIPAIVININDDDSAVLALIENLQRKDLNFFEEAQAYYHLLFSHGMTQEMLSQKLGKNQSTISNKIRLLKLPKNVQKKIIDNNLTERHARALLRIPDPELQEQIVDKAIKRELNVASFERLVQEELDKMLNNKLNSKIRENIRIDKGYKLIFSTIKEAVSKIKNCGIEIDVEEKEDDKYITCIIRYQKC